MNVTHTVKRRGPARHPARLLVAALAILATAKCGTPTPRPTSLPFDAPPTPGIRLKPTSTQIPVAASISSPTPTPSAVPTPAYAASATLASSATPRPSNTPPPSSTPDQPGQPAIVEFTARPATLDPGDVVTLTWSSQGGSHATIYKLFYSGQLSPEGITVRPTGSITCTIAEQERNWVDFVLYVWDDDEQSTNAGASVRLRCPDVWFLEPPPEDICPTEALVSPAAEQQFEGGTMIWVEAQDVIYVLFDLQDATARWTRFEDHWDESMPDRDPGLVAPPGRLQPIRGFGLLWRENPGLQERLGWALDEERGYTTVIQRTTRYKYNAWYLLGQDGDAWYLGPEGASWNKVSVAQLNIVPE